jgi:hypothetical protein
MVSPLLLPVATDLCRSVRVCPSEFEDSDYHHCVLLRRLSICVRHSVVSLLARNYDGFPASFGYDERTIVVHLSARLVSVLSKSMRSSPGTKCLLTFFACMVKRLLLPCIVCLPAVMLPIILTVFVCLGLHCRLKCLSVVSALDRLMCCRNAYAVYLQMGVLS